jgi:DNA-binding transcriptional ArsR family regulator
MSATVSQQDRLNRLVGSGFRGMCRLAERISVLRKRVEQVDDLMIRRLEQLFFGLADRTRLRILDFLTAEELCACEIVAALNLTRPNTSHHLGILERAGLVETHREGKWVFYRASRSAKSLYSRGIASVSGGRLE